jgi:hypothetical protein
MEKEARVRVIKTRVSKWVICPFCGMRQLFKKERENWRMIKDINLDKPFLFKVQTIYAKCLNPHCQINSFALPNGFEKYQRATERFKQEALTGLICDNSTLPRVAKRLNRTFNTTGSKSTLDRWKHKEADKYDFKELISKLGFSGILCIDEYKPKRSKTYDLIASDRLTDRILYLENLPKIYSPKAVGSIAKGLVEDFAYKLKGFGITPFACIVDLSSVYPKQLKKVWPDIIIQFDYFHIVKIIYWYFKNAIRSFRLAVKNIDEYSYSDLWKHKWSLLKNFDKLSLKEHSDLEYLMKRYKGSLIEKILIFKEQVKDIFNLSQSAKEAYQRREELIKERYWRDSYHLSKIVKFLSNYKFDYMISYLKYPSIPRSGNSESCIRIWRQMEKVRYGLTAKGRQNHLKLYQIYHYLGGKVE